MPHCLSCGPSGLQLDQFDTIDGTLFGVRFVSEQQIQLVSVSTTAESGSVYIGRDLCATQFADKAVSFHVDYVSGTRSLPTDCAARLSLTSGAGRIYLCSENEASNTKRVLLLSESDAGAMNAAGDYLFNSAWEFTPNVENCVDENEMNEPEWVRNVLLSAM